MCTLLLKAAKLNFCLLSGSFETGTDGRACSEGNKQIPGGSGRETWNVYAALKQETENIHHVQHPSYRGEIPAALHASQDLSEARDSCSLKGRSSHHVALRGTKVALSRPGPFSLHSACVDSACPELNSVPSGRFHTSCTGRIVLEPSRFVSRCSPPRGNGLGMALIVRLPLLLFQLFITLGGALSSRGLVSSLVVAHPAHNWHSC